MSEKTDNTAPDNTHFFFIFSFAHIETLIVCVCVTVSYQWQKWQKIKKVKKLHSLVMDKNFFNSTNKEDPGYLRSFFFAL